MITLLNFDGSQQYMSAEHGMEVQTIVSVFRVDLDLQDNRQLAQVWGSYWTEFSSLPTREIVDEGSVSMEALPIELATV